jgi:uncharacterized protein (TIGR02118 family)
MATGARFVVLWGTPEDQDRFDRHYRDVHIPLAKQLPGLRRYTVSRNATTMRGGAPYYVIAELDFDDMVALRNAFSSPQGQATAADVASLAEGTAVHSMVYELEDA